LSNEQVEKKVVNDSISRKGGENGNPGRRKVRANKKDEQRNEAEKKSISQQPLLDADKFRKTRAGAREKSRSVFKQEGEKGGGARQVNKKEEVPQRP